MHMNPVERAGLFIGRTAADLFYAKSNQRQEKAPRFQSETWATHGDNGISGLNWVALREAENACGGRDSTTLARR
jgi:hypothetical protein